MGGYLGLYEVTTPSGQRVQITAQEEAQIAKRALEWKLEQDLMAKERLKQAAVESGINAIGNMLGLAAGAYLFGQVLGLKLGR
jgi:hypothetical protein